MSFTRFHDDEIRIQKQLQQQTYPGRYQIDVPGQGSSMPFQEDVHLPCLSKKMCIFACKNGGQINGICT